MKKLLVTVMLAAALPACSAGTAGTVQPAAGGDAAAASGAPVQRRYVAADVRFMQLMIVHHEQALVLTALAPERTTREEIRMLAERIDASQADEIARMRAWLTRRGAAAALPLDEHAAHGGAHAMPGLLTAAELARLRAARGAEFERLFLDYMVRHHEGALTMVAELYATPGAGQEPELFQFAAHVDADQRAEIARMRRMLDAAR